MTDYDSAPSEVGGALGRDSEMLKTVIESRTRPYIDLMKQSSSDIEAICGKISEAHWPHWPYCLKL